MGASVSNFAKNVAKTVAKTATTALGNMIPVVGPTLAGAINSAYKNGGQVTALEMGGVVPEGFKAKVIDTPQQLMTLVKQFPTEAKKAGLSLGIIKDAVNNIPAEMMKRGGRKKKVVRQKQKQSQNVKVNVRVGDTVTLRPDSQKPQVQPRMSYAEPLRLAGPGFTFANAPAPSQASTYANAPAAVQPLTDKPFRSSSDPSMDSNRNKSDDVLQVVNPSGITPGVKEIRAIAAEKSAAHTDAQSALPAVSSSSVFEGRPVGPVQGGVPEVRALPSSMKQATLDFARPGEEASEPAPRKRKPTIVRGPSDLLALVEQLPSSARSNPTTELRQRMAEYKGRVSELELERMGFSSYEEALQQQLEDEVDRSRGAKKKGGRVSVF